MNRSTAVGLARDCLVAGIRAAHPRSVVPAKVSRSNDRLVVDGTAYDLGAFDEVVLVGGGKAAGTTAVALEEILGDRLDRGVVVATEACETTTVRVLSGDHPLPTDRNVAATREVLDLARAAGERTLVVAVITGGASALLAAPADGVELADLRDTTSALLRRGAGIEEVNAVRKHLSAVKGGRLAVAAAPATVVGILLSDVVGDDPAIIGSGPIAPDPSTYAEAKAVLDRYDVENPRILDHVATGEAGGVHETPAPENPAFARVDLHVIATSATAIDAARETARDRGSRVLVLTSCLRGEAREAGRFHAALAEECRATGQPVEPPVVLLSGGETTVTVRGSGRGGPNLECVLAAGIDLSAHGAAFAAVDTDGRDGGTPAAGGVVTAQTVDDVQAARRALDENDAFGYLADRDALIRTGATGTNVNDLRAVVVE